MYLIRIALPSRLITYVSFLEKTIDVGSPNSIEEYAVVDCIQLSISIMNKYYIIHCDYYLGVSFYIFDIIYSYK